MDHIINEILKKHGIEDEKLAAALAEIFELHTEMVKDSITTDIQTRAIVNGITL